jgi:hypothetical protein
MGDVNGANGDGGASDGESQADEAFQVDGDLDGGINGPAPLQHGPAQQGDDDEDDLVDLNPYSTLASSEEPSRRTKRDIMLGLGLEHVQDQGREDFIRMMSAERLQDAHLYTVSDNGDVNWQDPHAHTTLDTINLPYMHRTKGLHRQKNGHYPTSLHHEWRQAKTVEDTLAKGFSSDPAVDNSLIITDETGGLWIIHSVIEDRLNRVRWAFHRILDQRTIPLDVLPILVPTLRPENPEPWATLSVHGWPLTTDSTDPLEAVSQPSDGEGYLKYLDTSPAGQEAESLCPTVRLIGDSFSPMAPTPVSIGLRCLCQLLQRPMERISTVILENSARLLMGSMMARPMHTVKLLMGISTISTLVMPMPRANPIPSTFRAVTSTTMASGSRFEVAERARWADPTGIAATAVTAATMATPETMVIAATVAGYDSGDNGTIDWNTVTNDDTNQYFNPPPLPPSEMDPPSADVARSPDPEFDRIWDLTTNDSEPTDPSSPISHSLKRPLPSVSSSPPAKRFRHHKEPIIDREDDSDGEQSETGSLRDLIW